MILISVLYKIDGNKNIIGKLKNSVKRILAEYNTDKGVMLIMKTSRKRWESDNETKELLRVIRDNDAVVYAYDTRNDVDVYGMVNNIVANPNKTKTDADPYYKEDSTNDAKEPVRIATLIGKISIINEINKIGVFDDTLSVMKYGYTNVKVATLLEDMHVSVFDDFDKKGISIEVSELVDGQPPRMIYNNHICGQITRTSNEVGDI